VWILQTVSCFDVGISVAKQVYVSIGICDCDPGHYGLDCSLYLTPECVSSATFPETCWKTQFLDCRTFQVTITTGGFPISQQIYKLDEITSLNVVPCTPFINEDTLQCEICVDMNNLTVSGQELIGCPTVKTSCNSLPVSETEMACYILADTTQLICNPPSVTPNTIPSNTTDSDTSRTSKTILIVLVAVLAVLMVLGLGYLFVTRYLGINPSSLLYDTGSPVTYIEDEEPLQDNQDDDDS